MKALVWKDAMVNSVVIAYALITSVGVFVVMAAANQIFEWRTGFPWQEWPKLFGLAATLSLVLELVTAVLLGGCAFASERADWTAEFMAYLPVSRGQIILSKSILTLAVFAFIALLDVGVIFLAEGRNGAGGGDSFWKPAGVFASIAWCMFGCAWFVSTMSRSHGLSAAAGLLTPIGCAGFMLGLTKWMGWSENWLDRAMPILLAALGTVGYAAGVKYYLWRVEP